MLPLNIKIPLKKINSEETNPQNPQNQNPQGDNLFKSLLKTCLDKASLNNIKKRVTAQEKFVITVGDNGSIVTLHSGDKIKSSLFFEILDEESEKQVKELFRKHRNIQISLLLDNLDQTYKKKSYPLVSMRSLQNIAKREMASDGDKTSFKNCFPFVPKRSSGLKKSECLYIMASRSELIDKWLDILLSLPNRLTGIYVLPVESYQLYTLLQGPKEPVKKEKKPKKKKGQKNLPIAPKPQEIKCMIVHNKIGGTRQIVYSDRGIVFTRIVNYDFNQSDWLEHYEQDIYSTFEYLKRSFPTINIAGLQLTNIFGEKALEQIKNMKNSELNFINYTPAQAAEKIGYRDIISPEEDCCDLLMSKVFSKEKRLLQFTTPQIQHLEKLFLIVKSSYILNLLITISILVSLSSIALYSGETKSLIKIERKNKVAATKELNAIRINAAKENVVDEEVGHNDVERIIDLGRIDDGLDTKEKEFIDFYSDLKFFRQNRAQLSDFKYSLNKFEYTKPERRSKHSILVRGKLINKGGDIDDLFKKFDNLVIIAEKEFKDYEVRYKELPRTIDFTKKHYEYPIEFTILNKK